MIRLILNRVPRSLLQRVARWVMPLVSVLYRGEGVECPVCGGRFRRFLPYGYVDVRKGALCPGCLSLERHRLLWLWLERETSLQDGDVRFLHVAPEICLSKKFQKLEKPYCRQRGADVALTEVANEGTVHTGTDPSEKRGSATDGPRSRQYITADLESPLADVKMDVQAIPFPDCSFDVVMCNHVLEHVGDDRKAMRELHRVTKQGGWGVLLSPVDETRAETFEDDTIIDPAERTKVFGQYDHRRIYGRDYADRLAAAGWNVEKIDYLASLTDAERQRFGLRYEPIYIVRKC